MGASTSVYHIELQDSRIHQSAQSGFVAERRNGSDIKTRDSPHLITPGKANLILRDFEIGRQSSRIDPGVFHLP